MKDQNSTPMLASREFAALPCVTAIPAADARRHRTAGMPIGFAHCTGSLTWSPPI